jgi:hypothetical protein
MIGKALSLDHCTFGHFHSIESLNLSAKRGLHSHGASG